METLQFKQWSEFRNFVDQDRQILPVYWRGQRAPSWPLASSFERTILDMCGGSREGASRIYPYDGRFNRGERKIWEPGFYPAKRDRYLDTFKVAASGLRGPNPRPLSTEEWRALGRHYGLVPLLDWTEKPYIAAFFTLTEMLDLMRTPSGISFSGEVVALYRLFHNEQLARWL